MCDLSPAAPTERMWYVSSVLPILRLQLQQPRLIDVVMWSCATRKEKQYVPYETQLWNDVRDIGKMCELPTKVWVTIVTSGCSIFSLTSFAFAAVRNLHLTRSCLALDVQFALYVGVGYVVSVTKALSCKYFDRQVARNPLWLWLLAFDGQIAFRFQHPTPSTFKLSGIEHHGCVDPLEVQCDLQESASRICRTFRTMEARVQTIWRPKRQRGAGSRLEERTLVPFGYALMK